MQERFQVEPDNKSNEFSLFATLAAIGIVSLFAFSQPVRREIFKRDHGQSVWSGETENLEAAHINHDKSDPRYDTSSNGRLLTVAEHLQDHINTAGHNGLPEHQNNWAIEQLKKRAGV